MNPVNNSGNPPQKPSALGKFGRRLVSAGGSALKAGAKGLLAVAKAPFIPTYKLLSYETTQQRSMHALINVFTHRNARTDEDKKARRMAVTDAMGKLANDYLSIKNSKASQRKEELFWRTTADAMGLSDTCGLDPKARIANIHYWIIACERDINKDDLTPEEQYGLQIMQMIIRQTVEEFQQKNVAVLSDAIKDYKGNAPSNEDIAKQLLKCLSQEDARHQVGAKVGYDFEALKEAKLDYYNNYGEFGPSILEDYYMAPVAEGGLGLNRQDAIEQHDDDWNADEGPYAPDFWDGSPGRTLTDLMRHVDVEKLQDKLEGKYGVNKDKLYDLRFPVKRPQEPHYPRPFSTTTIEYEDPDYFEDPSFIDTTPKRRSYSNPPFRTKPENPDVIDLQYGYEDPLFDPDPYYAYSMPFDFEPQILSTTDPKDPSKAHLQQGSPSFVDPLVSQDLHVDKKQPQHAQNQRRKAPHRSQPQQLPEVKKGEGHLHAQQPQKLESSSSKLDVKASSKFDPKVIIEFPGFDGLLDDMSMSDGDRRLLNRGLRQPLEEVFVDNPAMSKKEKIDLIQETLDWAKKEMALDQAFDHYYGLEPRGEGKDVGEFAIRGLFSNMYDGGPQGDTIASALREMAFKLGQGKLDKNKEVVIKSLLKPGVTLEDFKSFKPEELFDYFDEKNLPKLLAFTTGREVVILGQNEDKIEGKSYPIDGKEGQNISADGFEHKGRLVCFVDGENWQVLQPKSEDLD